MARKRIAAIGADIVYSPDDGGWWVQLWQQVAGGKIEEIKTESPTFPTASTGRDMGAQAGRRNTPDGEVTMTDRRLVILESPYGSKDPAEVAMNVAFARACVRDALNRGEAPIASHLLYTQPGILRDEVPDERAWGIDAGLAWRRVAEASVVYTDLGVSPGMQKGINAALEAGRKVERRMLPRRVQAGSRYAIELRQGDRAPIPARACFRLARW